MNAAGTFIIPTSAIAATAPPGDAYSPTTGIVPTSTKMQGRHAQSRAWSDTKDGRLGPPDPPARCRSHRLRRRHVSHILLHHDNRASNDRRGGYNALRVECHCTCLETELTASCMANVLVSLWRNLAKGKDSDDVLFISNLSLAPLNGSRHARLASRWDKKNTTCSSNVQRTKGETVLRLQVKWTPQNLIQTTI